MNEADDDDADEAEEDAAEAGALGAGVGVGRALEGTVTKPLGVALAASSADRRARLLDTMALRTLEMLLWRAAADATDATDATDAAEEEDAAASSDERRARFAATMATRSTAGAACTRARVATKAARVAMSCMMAMGEEVLGLAGEEERGREARALFSPCF